MPSFKAYISSLLAKLFTTSTTHYTIYQSIPLKQARKQAMGSFSLKLHQQAQSLILLLQITLFFTFLSPLTSAQQSEKVEVTLYYESLCPYCSYFIAHNLVRLFTDGLISIVNLRLVPWGNSAIDASGFFQCQHGTGECLLNTVEACATYVYPDPVKQYFLIQCIESLAYKGREAEWQSCFSETSVDPQPLFDCYNQGIGSRLELQYASETAQLNPPHIYVPWVLVNNQPIRQDYQNFMSYICRAYRGTSVPAICNSAEIEMNSLNIDSANAAQQQAGCFVRDQQNFTSFEPKQILQQTQGSNN